MTVAPAVSVNAGFNPRDIFITQGNQIFKFTPPAGPLTLFTTLSACGNDHTGITFDHVGTFGNNMILSCENGTVWSVNGAGTSSVVATLPDIENEGPAVAPLSFGPFGGQILLTNDNDAVNAVRNDGFVTLNAFVIGAGTGPESVQVIPQTLCTYCGSNGSFFQAVEAGSFGSFPGLYEYFPIDFSGLGGDILVPCEGNSQIVRIHFNGSSYDMFFFDAIVGSLIEGSGFIDCKRSLAYAYTYSDVYAYAYAYGNSDIHADSHSYIYADTYSYSYSYSDGYVDAYAYSHADRDTDYMRYFFCYW
jgi:hypothetical protein